MNNQETIQYFNQKYEEKKYLLEKKSNFYCGITNDLETRKQQHNVDEYIACVKCDSFKTSKEIEALLHQEEYDTGKQLGNGNEESIYVYMYRKISGQTKE